MKIIKKIYSLVTVILLFCMLGIGVMMIMFPDASGDFIGYRMYSILTDSMQPQIPTDSLVLVRTLQDGKQPTQHDVITFEADRFGQPITLTHIYDKSEVVNGTTYYRTHAYGVETYDPYDVAYENIKGVYVFHVPYIGKYMLFLGSPYGICLLVICAFIMFLYHYANEHFDLDEEFEFSHWRYARKHHSKEALFVKNLMLNIVNGNIIVRGELINATSIAIYKVKANIIFLDERDQIVASKQLYLVQKDAVASSQHRKWMIECKHEAYIKDVYVEILGAKKVIRKKYK